MSYYEHKKSVRRKRNFYRDVTIYNFAHSRRRIIARGTKRFDNISNVTKVEETVYESSDEDFNYFPGKRFKKKRRQKTKTKAQKFINNHGGNRAKKQEQYVQQNINRDFASNAMKKKPRKSKTQNSTAIINDNTGFTTINRVIKTRKKKKKQKKKNGTVENEDVLLTSNAVDRKSSIVQQNTNVVVAARVAKNKPPKKKTKKTKNSKMISTSSKTIEQLHVLQQLNHYTDAYINLKFRHVKKQEWTRLDCDVVKTMVLKRKGCFRFH